MKTMSLVTVFAVVFGLSAFGLPDAQSMLATSTAYAKNEKGDRGNNGNSRGAGGRDFGAEVAGRGHGRSGAGISVEDDEPRGRGHIARELKNLNAANAFKNGNAPSASATSNVGQIAAYREAMLGNAALVEQYGSPEELDAAMTEALNELVNAGVATNLIDETNTIESLSADKVTELQTAIGELDPISPTYDDDLEALQGQIDAINEAATAYSEAQTNLAALEGGMVDSTGSLPETQSLSEKALAAFHDLLGIGD